MIIHNIEVRGSSVDEQTRCAHYKSEMDIIAIKFKCCAEWFPCFECHDEHADHPPQTWSLTERQTAAILCGACGLRLSIEEYFKCGAVCPGCGCRFNPGCACHYELYFEV